MLKGESLLSECDLHAIPSMVCQMPEVGVQCGVIDSHLGFGVISKESSRFIDLACPTPSQTTKL